MVYLYTARYTYLGNKLIMCEKTGVLKFRHYTHYEFVINNV